MSVGVFFSVPYYQVQCGGVCGCGGYCSEDESSDEHFESDLGEELSDLLPEL